MTLRRALPLLLAVSALGTSWSLLGLAQDGVSDDMRDRDAPTQSLEPTQSEPEEEHEEDDEPVRPSSPFADLSKDAVEQSLSRALEQPEAAFCKELRVGARDDDLCDLSKLKQRQRCPALARACDAPAAAPRNRAESAASGFGDLLFFAMLAALIVLCLVALRRVLGSAQMPILGAPRQPAPAPAAPAARVRSPQEADVARLWALAQEHARAGRFEQALGTLKGALIHALRLSGKLHVTPALTHGDYLRSLRSDAELHGAAREVFRSVEAVEFGGAPATGDTFRRLFERVQPIVQRALALICLLLLVFEASACSSLEGAFGSGAPHGRGVLTRLLAEQQTTVRQRIRPLNEIEPEVRAILVEGEQQAEVWDKLFDFVANGGTLLVVAGSPDLERATSVRFEARPYDGKLEVSPELEAPALELSAVTDFALLLPSKSDPNQLRASEVLARASGRPYVVRQYYGAGDVIFFGDARFLGNASLSVGDNAFFAVGLLQRPGGVLEMVGPWTGGGADSTLSALSKAGLGTVMAQLAVVALLFGWFGGVAFGKRRDPELAHRRAFRDHVLALAENYRRARATRFALATYGAWLIERLRDRLSPQQPIGLIELAGRLAERVDAPEAALVLLLTEAREAQDDLEGAKPNEPDLLTLNRIEMWTARLGGSK